MTLVRRLLIGVAGLVVVPLALLAFGTLFSGVPYLGTAGTFVLPMFAGPLAVVALVGSALGVVAALMGARRAGMVCAALGLGAAIVAAAVIVRHAGVAAANGASVSLLATVVPRGLGAGAAPDATVTYTQVDGRDLEIDIYRPVTRDASRAPVVMYTHGGGWILGERTMRAASLRWFADRGFVAVSAQYALATPGYPTWNTATAQVACALAWTAGHVAAYGGDPERMFAFGDSAGGALTLSATYAAAAGIAEPSCGGTVPKVRAVAAEYPAVDPVSFYENTNPLFASMARRMVGGYLGGSPREYPQRARSVSSVTYVTPAAPPTLIFLVDNDHLVPIAGALDFIERAEQAGVNVRTVRFPWADHAVNLQYYNVPNQAMLQIMLQHFCRYGGGCDTLAKPEN